MYKNIKEILNEINSIIGEVGGSAELNTDGELIEFYIEPPEKYDMKPIPVIDTDNEQMAMISMHGFLQGLQFGSKMSIQINVCDISEMPIPDGLKKELQKEMEKNQEQQKEITFNEKLADDITQVAKKRSQNKID